MALPEDQHGSRSSRRSVPTRRSQIAFIRGARTAVRKILVPLVDQAAQDGSNWWPAGGLRPVAAQVWGGDITRPVLPPQSDRRPPHSAPQ
jgi:hypothetical protein